MSMQSGSDKSHRIPVLAEMCPVCQFCAMYFVRASPELLLSYASEATASGHSTFHSRTIDEMKRLFPEFAEAVLKKTLQKSEMFELSGREYSN